jgi:flagellar hook assembly protein FlgD
MLFRILIYDYLGREVKTLVNETRPAGTWVARWDGTDNHGESVGSGVFFYRLQADHFHETRKLIMIR